MNRLAVCALPALLLLAAPAAGLEPYLVKDIEPATTTAGSNPSHLVTFRGAVLYFADDGVSGSQLWRTDGTAAGTWPLSDFPKGGYPVPFLATERLYFFVLYDSRASVRGLWVSDGTAAGTVRLTGADVSAGLQGLFSAGRDLLYFAASDPEHGEELWHSDGTPAGTRIVADARPGPEGSDIRELVEHRGLVWFSAHGNTVWRTDGTAAGTALAIDPVPGWEMEDEVTHLQTLGSRLVFFAPSSRGLGSQLWAGDGTARGTRPITNLPRDIYLVPPPVVQAGKLYFLAGREEGGEDIHTLWVSDGTPRGTRVLIRAPSSRVHMEHLLYARGMGNRLFFEVERRGYGREPWVTDGTPGGTRMLRDVCPGPCTSYTYFQEAFGGRLYFTASAADALERVGLWSTDGTPEGTSLVSELCPEDRCTHDPPQAAFVVGERLVFVERAGDSDMEVWSTDGTGEGTVQLTDLEPMFPWGEGFHGAVLNGQLLFNADDGEHGDELWRTDGTRAGTAPVADLNRSILGVSSSPGHLMSLGSLAFFFTGPRIGPDTGFGDAPVLWKSDGTEAGTVPVKTFGPEEREGAQPVPWQFAAAGGVLVYSAYDQRGGGIVVWRTDGTEPGTFRLTGTSASLGWSSMEMESVGSTVFFTFKGDHGTGLRATDGTLAGTRPLVEALPSEPRFLTSFQGELYFAAPGLWRSDGTAAGTQAVADVHPIHLTVHAGRLWFFTDEGGQLWSTDGTAAGTRVEADFGPEPGLFQANALVSFGDRLLLSFEEQGLWVKDGTGTRRISDREILTRRSDLPGEMAVLHDRLFYRSSVGLQVTDGTEAGTEQLVARDGNGIYVASMEVLGDRVVFVAREVLWESDGTPAGTFPTDPEVALSFPASLFRAGDRVFFSGFEPTTGWELWAVRP